MEKKKKSKQYKIWNVKIIKETNCNYQEEIHKLLGMNKDTSIHGRGIQ